MGIRQWDILGRNRSHAEALARDTGLPALLCAVLHARGYVTAQSIHAFLQAPCSFCDPYLLKDMDLAVRRIHLAVESAELIAVYGDYDCDGITATALLVSYLQSVGARVFYYLPDREKEGYGMNQGAVETLAQMGTRLIITVDNGISAHEEIACAALLGMDVVVTDHHRPRDTLPPAAAVVNPCRCDCSSPCKDLTGVGVAFKLVCALEEADAGELLEYYSELVALGTVGDVAPLTGENRAFVAHGLAHMRETQSQGIRALLEASGLGSKPLGGDSLAFGLVPLLNACGRMGSADDAVELLLTDDASYAAELVVKIYAMNQQRKKTEDTILLEIEAMLRESPSLLHPPVLLLSGKGWHHGVVGIVSAKLAERYHKPCILFSLCNGEARGSGRSVEGFSIIEAIAACSQHLTRYGGHTLAAGLTLPEERLGEFSEQFLCYVRERGIEAPPQTLFIDCELRPEDLTVEAVSALAYLEPFGEGMRAPLFLLRALVIAGIYPTADKKHMRIRLAPSGGPGFYAIYFRMSEQDFPYAAGDTVDIVAGADVSEYNGNIQVSVKIRDIRLHNVPQKEILAEKELYRRIRRGECQSGNDLESILPQREDFAAVYRYLKKTGGYRYGTEELYYRLMDTVRGFGKLLAVLDIFEECGLAQCGEEGIRLTEPPPRVDIEASEILLNLRKRNLVKNGV